MLPAKTVNYVGPLGRFSYQTDEFEVMQKYSASGIVTECLRYKGLLTDGSKIRIPDGVVDASYMFEGKPLVTPPKIPDSVLNTSHMFQKCVSLVRGAVLPLNVKNTGFMYAGCRSLERVPGIPDKTTETSYMFDGCTSLQMPPIVPGSVKRANGMFRGCVSMMALPSFPADAEVTGSIKNCSFIDERTIGQLFN